jgi:abequosyltransferase
MSIKLSICIPTYNRDKFLPDLFDSILNDVDDSVAKNIEIVVSDNASTDNTDSIISLYKQKFSNKSISFVFHKWKENMGADRNFLKVVELASGEYCWLMGSDDKILDGSIKYILNKLEENKKISGMSLNRIAYDFYLKKPLREKPVADGLLKSDTILKNIDDIVFYLGDYFGYISGQVIRRDLWMEVVNENKDIIHNYFNAYVHVFIIFNMLKKNPLWEFLFRPCVGWRSGNDSFLVGGLYKRVMLDIMGYEKIAGNVFGRHSNIYHNLMKKVGTVHVFYGILGWKFGKKEKGEFLKLFLACMKYYHRYPKFWFKTFILLITPTFALKIIRFIYRKTLKKLIYKKWLKSFKRVYNYEKNKVRFQE